MGLQIKCAIFSYSDPALRLEYTGAHIRQFHSQQEMVKQLGHLLPRYCVLQAGNVKWKVSWCSRFVMEDVESFAETQMSVYDCLIFDLDDTLYPLSSGLQAACRKNIEEYMVENLKIVECEVPSMCVELYKAHGTTMAGLKALGYEFDNDEFHSFVHGRLPYDNLKPDPLLRNLLLSMPQRKIVFTNADRIHAAKVLSRLDLEDCFEGVICFETLNLSPQATHIDKLTLNPCPQAEQYRHAGPNTKSTILCKPSPQAFQFVLNITNADPKRTIFFDDSARNIATAKATGMHCVLVGRSIKTEDADFALGSIHNIKEAIPEIWENEEISENTACSNPALAIETVVVA